jgi:tetratricopeptide (TPR) repeat protein
MPDPEQIYIPPRFHLGQILMEAGRYAEAAESFLSALSEEYLERGKFLAWRGDALTIGGKDDAALKSYLAAFLDDPITVDMQSVKNRKITNLHTSLNVELDDEIEEEDEPAWLPVWGWLHGVFALPLQPAPEQASPGAAEIEALLAHDDCSIPRIWFNMLTHAERLRVISRDDRELSSVRRLMKKTNGFMFGWYMEKIGGRR